MTSLPVTPGQTVGPFFGFGLPYAGGDLLVPPHHPEAVRLHGDVLDGDGQPVPDALLEVWQADRDGRAVQNPGSLRRDGYTFTGWGRSATDDVGHYSFTTIEPGRSDGAPAFFALTVFARGLMHRLLTRIYLPEALLDFDAELDSGAEPDSGTELDPFLRSVPADRRGTLLARRDGAASLRFDVHLQGPQETVFLTFADRRTGADDE